MTDQTFRVFIGWDGRFPEPARVLAHSLVRRSSVPLDIRFLDKRHLGECYGFRRKVEDPLASTEFTYSRFLVPWLCGFDGHALFMDNDMVCLGDVAELFCHTGPLSAPLQVVKHDHAVVDGSKKMYGAVQTAYPRKNWSSLMLMHCRHLTCWSKEIVETASGARLHRFEDVPDNDIEALNPKWNVLDVPTAGTRIMHWTSGGPWFPGYEDCPGADLWYAEREHYLAALR